MHVQGVETAPAHKKYAPVKEGIERVANVFAFNGQPLPADVDLTGIPLYWHNLQDSYRLSRLIPSRNYQGTIWDLSIEQAPRNPNSPKTYQTAWTDHADFRLALSAHTERSDRETPPNFVQLLVAGMDGKDLVFNRTGAPPNFTVEDLLAKRRFRPEAVVAEVEAVLEAAKADFLKTRAGQLDNIRKTEPQRAIVDAVANKCNELVDWSKERRGKKRAPDRFLLWGSFPSHEANNVYPTLRSLNLIFACSDPENRENWQRPYHFSGEQTSWTRITDYNVVPGRPFPRETLTGSTDFSAVQTSRDGESFQSEGQITLYKHAPEPYPYRSNPRTLSHSLKMGVQEVPYAQFDQQVADFATTSFLDHLRSKVLYRVKTQGVIIAASDQLQLARQVA